MSPFVDRLEPMLEGICQHMTPMDVNDSRPRGMIVDGCINHPWRFATRHELLWTLAYTLMALYYLERGAAP